jgi:hypothetical protein
MFNSSKYIVLLFVLIAIVFSCKQEPTTVEDLNPVKTSEVSEFIRNPVTYGGNIDSSNVAMIAFEHEVYNFGTVEQGAEIRHSFEFTNKGNAPLLISNVKATCGCTIPEWPEAPIVPGESGEISVLFKTVNRINYQEKPIIIYANTLPNKTILKLKGNIIKSE